MTCIYCGTRNGNDEQRCHRCGRKPDDTLTGEFVLQKEGALAAQLVPVAQHQPSHQPIRNMSRAVQRPLFRELEPKVISMDGYAPPVKPAPRARPRTARPSRVPLVSEDQGSLDFLPPASSKPRTLGTAVEAVIYCEDPVGTTLHRAVAAALDWSMVLFGWALFLGMFRVVAGEFELTRLNLMVFAGMLPVVAFGYGLMWALAGRETAGMRWTGLHLTTFDGEVPERRQLLLRFAGSCLSLCTVIGLLWSFADEENLAWQDHISRTFPTPGLKNQQFLRQ